MTRILCWEKSLHSVINLRSGRHCACWSGPAQLKETSAPAAGYLAFRPLSEWTQVHGPFSVRGHLSKNHTEDSTYTWIALACQGPRKGLWDNRWWGHCPCGVPGSALRAFLSRKGRLETQKQHHLTRGERRGAHRAEFCHAQAGHRAAGPAQCRKATGRFGTLARTQGPLHRPRRAIPPLLTGCEEKAQL